MAPKQKTDGTKTASVIKISPPGPASQPANSATWIDRNAGWVAAASIVMTMAGVAYTRQQALRQAESNEIARRSVDRASGLIPAKLKLEDVVPNSETMPKELRWPILSTPFTTGYFVNPKQLIDLNQRVALRNVGEEPIDTIRLTVEHCGGFGPGELAGKLREEDFKTVGSESILIEKSFREDIPLVRKMNKGELAIVEVSKGLLHQMTYLQRGGPVEGTRYGEFVVRFYGRIVDGKAFDLPADDSGVRIRLQWAPIFFEPKACAELLGKMETVITVVYDAPKK